MKNIQWQPTAVTLAAMGLPWTGLSLLMYTKAKYLKARRLCHSLGYLDLAATETETVCWLSINYGEQAARTPCKPCSIRNRCDRDHGSVLKTGRSKVKV